MKNLIYLLMMLPLFFAACSNDDMVVNNEEAVEVSFCANVPQQITPLTKSDLSVNTVYCAVYEIEGEDESQTVIEHKNLRTEIEITEGEEIVFSPRLIKNRKYKVVFWACKAGAYNVEEMENITRIGSTTENPLSEADYDAFTYATDPFVVSTNIQENVTLKRPLAQLNMGVTKEDWNAVVSETTFGMTLATLVINLKASNSFNAYTQVAGADEDLTYTLPCGGEFTLNRAGGNTVTYKNLGMCYIMSNTNSSLPSITYSVYTSDNNCIVKDVTISQVTLEKNYRTYLVGALLTSVAEYDINLSNNWTNSVKDVE